MTEILIIIAILYGLSLIFNPKPNVLGCGLIGFIPNHKNHKANLDWIKIILSYNTFRGTDSCGIYMNHWVDWGVDKESDVRKWLANNELKYEDKTTNFVIMGHTRKSTRGANTAANAHPFLLDNDSKKNHKQLVLAHNGTINNIWSLANKRKINHTDIKVDSLALAKIIFETENYDVLKEYTGGAALLMQDPYEPNSMVIFKGASTNRSGVEEDERPLYYLKTGHGIYISSMDTSLYACAGPSADVKSFESNKVIKIKNNKLEVLQEIDRSKAHSYAHNKTINFNTQKASTKRTSNFSTNMSSTYEDEEGYFKQWEVAKKGTAPTETKGASFVAYATAYPDSVMDSYFEESFHIESNAFINDYVHYLGGRYVSNNITNSTLKTMNPSLPNFEGFLLHGFYLIDDMRGDTPKVREAVKTFEPVVTNVDKHLLFYKGVLIAGKKRDSFLRGKMYKELDNCKNIFQEIQKLSSFSCYPITYTHDDAFLLKEKSLKFYLNGNRCKDVVIQPLFQKRRYHFKKGILHKVDTSKKGDNIFKLSNPMMRVDHNLKVDKTDSTITTDPEIVDLLIYKEGVLNHYDIIRCSDELSQLRVIVESEKSLGVSPSEKYTICFEDQPFTTIDGSEVLERALQILAADLSSGEAINERDAMEEMVVKEIEKMADIVEEVKTSFNVDLETYIMEVFEDHIIETAPTFVTDQEEEEEDDKINTNNDVHEEEIGNETL